MLVNRGYRSDPASLFRPLSGPDLQPSQQAVLGHHACSWSSLPVFVDVTDPGGWGWGPSSRPALLDPSGDVQLPKLAVGHPSCNPGPLAPNRSPACMPEAPTSGLTPGTQASCPLAGHRHSEPGRLPPTPPGLALALSGSTSNLV